MSYDIAIVGEAWEASFAAATARAMAAHLPAGARVIVPPAFADGVAAVLQRPLTILPVSGGFLPYTLLREQLAPRRDRGLLSIAAGAMPEGSLPVERLGRALHRPRVVEWMPAANDEGTTLLGFRPPPHRPPAEPRHERTRIGTMELWTVDAGDSYFQGLLSLGDESCPPLWPQYGKGKPIFAYNTNDFSEPPPQPHDDYFILGSGLLGLRLVAESEPPADARVIVYDINHNQLSWAQFLLEAAEDSPELEDVMRAFRQRFPDIAIRDVMPHERSNSLRQAAWYAANRNKLVTLRQRVDFSFVQCDLLTNPGTLLNRIRPGRRLFFMFLDLFVVWNVESDRARVEYHPGMAASLCDLVESSAGGSVRFLPARGVSGIQLSPESPFAGG